MKSNKIYDLKLDSLSFLTLITKLQIHLLFGILQNTPAHSMENSSSCSKGSNNDQAF